MFRQFDEWPQMLSFGRSYTSQRPGSSRGVRTTSRGAVSDRDVPLFAAVRSAQGLPLDDPRWWPAASTPDRRDASWPGRPSVERALGVRQAVGLPVGLSLTEEISHPTVALLERTLAGLLAWDTTAAPVVDSSRPRRHELTVASTPA